MRTTIKLLFWLVLALPTLALSDSCRRINFDGASFTLCSADPSQQVLRLFLYQADGSILGTFKNLTDQVAESGRALGFAMNAGMYHANRAPVGLYIEDGQEYTPLVTRAGPGNFGMLPNGVLCLMQNRADIIESRQFAQQSPRCQHATQSGPMLVIDGALHPRFLPDSTSRYIRNGVGIGPDGQTHFAISDTPVTFHHFARLFRDHLNCDQALYFDGNISKLHAPSLDRSDPGFPMGPMIGLIK